MADVTRGKEVMPLDMDVLGEAPFYP